MEQTSVTKDTSPVSDGLIAPMRGEPHARTLIAWPVRTEMWESRMDEARAEYAAMANAIVRFEPVTMIAPAEEKDSVKAMCDERVEVLEVPIDDSWIRDNGPAFVSDRQGGVAMVDFRFNAYGGRFNPHDRDDAIPAELAKAWNMRRYESDMVLEGGGWTVDGRGTLITTEQCLLNPNRNPDLSREEIEQELLRCLGVTKVIWLPHGLAEDRDTDGHSDNVVQFVKPGKVVAQVAPDRDNPNAERLEENLRILKSSTDAEGNPLDVVEMAPLPYTEEIDGHRYAVPYTNFYPVNGAVIVPQLNAPREDEAFALLAEHFPDHEIVGVPSDMLAYGGGGVGCITLQVPAGDPLPDLAE